jgi:hypothetical protein
MCGTISLENRGSGRLFPRVGFLDVSHSITYDLAPGVDGLGRLCRCRDQRNLDAMYQTCQNSAIVRRV